MKTQDKLMLATGGTGFGAGLGVAIMVGMYYLMEEAAVGNGVAMGLLMVLCVVIGVALAGLLYYVMTNVNMRQDAHMMQLTQQNSQQREQVGRAVYQEERGNKAGWEAIMAEMRAMTQAKALAAPQNGTPQDEFGLFPEGDSVFQGL